MESKTLHTVQGIAKAGKVISKIVFICSIIGSDGCLIGILSLYAGVTQVLKFGGVTIHGIIEKSADISLHSMYAAMIIGIILCISELVLSKIAERYFKNELAAGTPFTVEGSAELKRLGIYTICIPLAAMLLSEIAYHLMLWNYEDIAEMSLDNFASVGLGIGFIVVSLICRCGAEMKETH